MANMREAAMLIHQRTRTWTGQKSDPRIRAAAGREHGVRAESIVGGSKRLIGATGTGPELLDAVSKLYGEANREHLSRTAPWLDSGERVISSAGYQDYMTAARAIEGRLDLALTAFCDWYAGEFSGGMTQARADLNGLFEWGDYPQPSRMRRNFVFEVEVLPFPAAEDFRVDLGAAEVERIKAQIERATDEAIKAAMGDVWTRIGDVIGHLAERMRAYDPSGDKVTGKFHDSLVGNVRELVALLPGLNVTQDANVAAMADRMGAILAELPAVGDVAGKDEAAAALRENEALRVKTAAAADAILEQMGAFV